MLTSLLAALLLSGCQSEPGPLIAIGPEDPTTSVSLVAEGPFPERRSWTWEVDGRVSLDTEGRLVAPEQTARGQVWTAHQWDGETWIGSATTTIVNEAPVVDLFWSPEPGTVALEVAVTDADGDEPELSVVWRRNGKPDTFTGWAHDPRTLVQGDRWTAEVTADDGFGGVTQASLLQEVGNAGPVLSELTVTPVPATAADELVASAHIQDLNGDRTTASWRWTVDGVVLEDVTTSVMPSGIAERGQIVVVEAEITDTYGARVTGSAQTVLVNARPHVDSADVQPAGATTVDELSCEFTGVIDADGDPLDFLINWTINGAPAADGPTLAAADTERGDEVRCAGRVRDELGAESNLVVANPISLANAAPSATGAVVVPSDPTTLDELTCEFTGFSDPDGDAAQGRFQWFVNGAFVSEGDTLEPQIAVHQDEVSCLAFPSDGTDEGIPVLSAAVPIANTPPEFDGIRFTPSTPLPWDSLICQPGIEDVDADGEPLQLTFEWFVDGAPYLDAVSTAHPGDTVAADVVQAGQSWTCRVRADDGVEEVETGAFTTVEDHPGGNVLIIVADDLGIDHLNRYGLAVNPPPTPTIDALIDSGVRFNNAWTYSSCSPTRAALMTGRYGRRTGATALVPYMTSWYELPLDEVTLPEVTDLATVGTYANSAVGKWHISSRVSPTNIDHPGLTGWDWFAGSPGNLDVNSLGLTSDFDTWEKWNNGVTEVSTTYATTDTVDDAIARANAMPEPWMLYVAFNAPHYPVHVPPAHLHTSTVTDTDPDHLQFDAVVEALDTEMGRMLAGIPTDVLDRTTIIFMSDNGTPRGVTTAPFDSARAKLTPYEGGINVPLVIAGPTVTQPGTETDALVHAVDILPTVAAITGVQISTLQRPDGSPQTIDGRHLLTWTLDPTNPSLRRNLYGEQSSPVGPPPYPSEDTLIATDGRYKLIRFNDHDEFFDLSLGVYDEGPDLLPSGLGPIQTSAYQALGDFVELQRNTLVYEGDPRPAP